MNIAVIICGLLFDSQKALMKGIERKVRDMGDVCSVFCINGNLNGDEAFVKGEHMIFDLPNVSKFDGVVLVKNTFVSSQNGLPKIFDDVYTYNIPCVCIDSFDARYVNITSDERASIYALVEHMIKEHNCRKFGYVSGIQIGTDAKLRYEGFINALNDNGIQFENRFFKEGNYEYKSGVEAAKQFAECEDGLPECIVCANDQMAVGVYTELKRRGIKIPKHVRLTGIDYDFVSRVISTRLTTIKRQQYQKGLKAIDILHHYEDYKPGDNFVLPIALSIGETCGCKCKDENHNDVDDALAVDRYEQAELTQYIKNMTVSFMSKKEYSSLIQEMRYFAYMMKPKELYLCMNIHNNAKIDYTDFAGRLSSAAGDKADSDYSDEILNVISCQNGESVRSGDKFARTDLFPPVANMGRPGVTYYFVPVHFMNENFGYAILGESGDLMRNDYFPNWVNAVSSAFENTRKIDLMGQMIDVLDKMWIYDTLTGIYNRAGFFKLSEPIVNDCIQKDLPVCVIFLDVDGLKSVNDNLGHDAGDCLIKDVANILKGVKKHGEIIMRYGGDEFVLMAAGYDESKAEETIRNIEVAMNALNERADHPYVVEASAGYRITYIKDAGEINSIIEDADKEMYKKKYIKKTLAGKI